MSQLFEILLLLMLILIPNLRLILIRLSSYMGELKVNKNNTKTRPKNHVYFGRFGAHSQSTQLGPGDESGTNDRLVSSSVVRSFQPLLGWWINASYEVTVKEGRCRLGPV